MNQAKEKLILEKYVNKNLNVLNDKDRKDQELSDLDLNVKTKVIKIVVVKELSNPKVTPDELLTVEAGMLIRRYSVRTVIDKIQLDREANSTAHLALEVMQNFELIKVKR